MDDISLQGKSATPTNYTISLSVNPSEAGTVNGAGTFASGSSRTVTASANSGYTFSKWTESGTQVSTNASYTFTLNSDRTLVANFTSNGPANSSCSSATTLGSSSINGTTVGSTNSSAPASSGVSKYGVWYTFSGDGSSTTITTSNSSSFDEALVIMSGSCSSLSLIKVQDSSGASGGETYTFTAECGTTYYVYVAYYGSSGTSSNTGSFTITKTTSANKPTVATGTAGTPTATGVTISSNNVSCSGGASITARGVYCGTSSSPTSGGGTSSGTTGTYSVNLSGLNSNTQYYARAYATNSAGTNYGSNINFTTLATVTTTAVSNIDVHSATVGGSWTTNSASVTERGIVYSTSNTAPTVGGSSCTKLQITSGSYSGYSTSLTGLSANTKYYVRAYVTNAGGTAYGSTLNFTTSAIYTITSQSDWNEFCACVNGGYTYSGETVTLANNVTLNSSALMAGSSTSYYFKGTFDGQSHTLTVAYTATANYCAPFRYANAATFQNLTVSGTITGNYTYCAGICSYVNGCTFTNCTSNVSISNNNNSLGGFCGYAIGTNTYTQCVSNATLQSTKTSAASTYLGGFEAYHYSGNSSFTGCVFKGTMKNTNGKYINYSGGIAGGRNSGNINITNCLVIPTLLSNLNTYAYTYAPAVNTNSNSYYYTDFSYTTAQNKKAYTITGSGVTVARSGSASATYTYSGITAYSTGLVYNNTLYAASGESIGLSLSGSGYYKSDHGTLTGTAHTGSSDAYTLAMEAYNTTISSKAQHTLTAQSSPSAGGTVKINSETAGTSVTKSLYETQTASVTATAADGYNFSSWSVSGTGASLSSTSTNPTSFTMGTANAMVTATFTKITYTVICTPSSGSNYLSYFGTAQVDEPITVTVHAATGYELSSISAYKTGASGTIVSLSGSGTADGSTRTFTMPAYNVTVEATFASTGYSITVNANNDDYGSVSGGGTYAAGTHADALSASPNAGYYFYQWSDGTNTYTANPLTITVSGAAIYTAEFRQAVHTLANASDWNSFAEAVSKGYTYNTETVTLNADLNSLSGAPVGTSAKPFQGTFNGNGHTVTYSNTTNSIAHKGLFGYVSGSGNIQNVIVNATLSGTGTTSAGTVVGTFASTGTISNVEGAGTITGNSTTNIGGIVGNMSSGTLHSSFSVATLDGTATNKGGLVGTNSGNIYNCYSNATLTTGNRGGLVGSNNSSGKVESCYAAGISGISAFAYSNSGMIQNCYTNAIGNGYIGPSSTAPTGSATYGAVQSDIKDMNYMYRDNLITKNTNTYVGSNDAIKDGIKVYADRHTPVWNGLLSALNQWVRSNPRSVTGLTSWRRPLTTSINGDLPVLAFPQDSTLATTDGKYLQYSTSLNSLLGSCSSAHIFHYGKASGVSNVPSTRSNHVYVAEDAVLLQSGSSDFTATVGITFDNSCRTAKDYYDNTLLYDWHFFSSPLSNASIGTSYSDGTISTLNGSYFPNGLMSSSVSWDLYTYFEPAYHWINLKRSGDNHWYSDLTDTRIEYLSGQEGLTARQNETIFVPGKGYMMAISQDSYMGYVDGTLNRGTVNITLTNKESGLETTYAKGWNLVGNPYQAYLNLGALTGYSHFYVYDADQGVYAPVTSNASVNPRIPSPYIHPHQAFFVHVKTDGATETLSFTPSMATTTSEATSYFRGEKINYPLVNIFAEDEAGHRDLAVIEFHRPEVDGVEKMDAMRNAPFRLSAHHDRTDYAILFTTDDMERIPVHFKTAEDGQMTLTWSTYNGEFNSLHLVDNITGVNYDMLAHDSYTFNASTEDYSARFYITYDCSGTGIEENDDNNGASTGSATFAYINNGNIIIDVADARGASLQVIDVMGRVLVCRDALNASPISTSGMAPGVYLLRLSDSKQVRVQKIVLP